MPRRPAAFMTFFTSQGGNAGRILERRRLAAVSAEASPSLPRYAAASGMRFGDALSSKVRQIAQY
jgi:hypothetical protein